MKMSFAALAGALAMIAGLAAAETRKEAPKIGDPPEALNMRLVGQNDLQGRTAYQPTVFKQAGRYIAYIGHHGGSADVPKPFNPQTGEASQGPTAAAIANAFTAATGRRIRELPLHPERVKAALA